MLLTGKSLCMRVDSTKSFACTKVRDLQYTAVSVDQDIISLDVAVHNFVLMLKNKGLS